MLEVSPNIGWNPPCPSSLSETEKRGQKLLALVRTIENEESCAAKVDDAITLFGDLIVLYSRRGLLQGDTQKAEQILSTKNPSLGGTGSGSGRLKNKRGQRKENPKMDTESAAATAAVDENLALSAVIRTCGMNYNPPLVALAANLCTAICQGIWQANAQTSTVALAEYDLLTSSGTSIIAGLSKISEQVLSSMYQGYNKKSEEPRILLNAILHDRSDDITALISCLRASASLICLFGTRLSRNTSLLSECRNVAWSALTVPEDSVQVAAAKLIAILPLAGGNVGGDSASRSPAEIWASGLMDSAVALSRLLSQTVPVRQITLSSNAESWTLSHHADRTLKGLISLIHESSGEKEEYRSSLLRAILKAHSGLVVAFMERDYIGPGNCPDFLDARICVDQILNLLEKMLSYPAAAESTFYLTKKRLRFEPLNGGLISPNSLAMDLASHIKQEGHQIFNVLLGSVDTSALLPYGRRILRMSCTALLSSVSGPLRKVIDPTSSALQFEGKKRRWLHTSISMRTAAVDSFSRAVLAFGLDTGRSSSRSSSQVSLHKANEFDKFVPLVGGCLLEQIVWSGSANPESDDWGDLSDRIDLLTASIRSLQGLLLSYRGFLPIKARLLVDSITVSGLKKIAGANTNLIFGMTNIRIDVLRLGCACLSTPWTDGSLSPIQEHLRVAASASNSGDPDVVTAAMAALRLCDSLSTPRVPALLSVTRRATADPGVTRTPVAAAAAEALIHDLQNAESEIVRAARAAEQSAKDKIAASPNPIQENEKSKRKRVAEKDESHVKARGVSAGPETQDSPKERESEPNSRTLGFSEEGGGDDQSEPLKHQVKSTETSNINRTSPTSNHIIPEKSDPNDSIEEDEDFMPGIVDDGPDEEDM